MLIVFLQAAALALSTGAAEPEDMAGGFSLDKLKAIPRCPAPVAGEIVVCGSRDQRSPYRLPTSRPEAQTGPPRAEARIGDATLGVDTESATLASGVVSQRIMARIKVPF